MSNADRTGDWEPAVFERNGQALLAAIRAHVESIRDIPVATPCDPMALLKALDDDLPEHGEDFGRILADTRERVIPNLVLWNHPRFHGYFPSSASFPGVLAETLTAALNVNAMLWKTSPAASALERTVLRWIAQMVGYPETSDGVLVNGASLGTLYALAAARDAAVDFDIREHGVAAPDVPRLRIYASEEAHSSVGKAAITLGLGLANVVRVPSDHLYRMRVDLLEQAIQRDIDAGAKPMAVVATIGTTSVGAADELGPIAELCRRHGVWLHVDAAYGGFYRLAPSLAGRLEDVSVGDSLVVNPQKTMFVPLEATALYCRRRGALANTFRLVPEYLRSAPGEGELDYMDLSPQLGRSFRSLKVWWVFRAFGRNGFALRLEHAVDLARWLRRAAEAQDEWRCVAPSVYPLVCLRYEPSVLRTGSELTAAQRRDAIDALNMRILSAVNASGEAYLSHSVVREGYVLRVSIGNVHTTRADVERVWDLLRRTAAEQLSGTVRTRP